MSITMPIKLSVSLALFVDALQKYSKKYFSKYDMKNSYKKEVL